MLVKNVLSRSMGAWIFAVALLVEVVFCVSREELNTANTIVKLGSITFLNYQLELKAERERIQRTGNVQDESMLDEFLKTMERKIKEGRQLLDSINGVMELGLDALFKTEYVEIGLPHPVGPYSMKAAHVQRFGVSLGGGLDHLEAFLKYWRNPVARKQALQESGAFTAKLSTLITTVNFPFIENNNRFVDLPKTTTEVCFEEMRIAHEAMQTFLAPYLPHRLGKNSGKKGWGVSVKCLLQARNGVINTQILDVLETLYANHRLYRLSASDAHIIYVKGCPNAITVTRALQKIIRTLNKFAGVLDDIMNASSFTWVFPEKLDNWKIYKRLADMDKTVKMWPPSIVFDLMKVMELRLDASVPTSTLQDNSMRFFPEVFAKVQEELQFYLTHKRLRSTLGAAATENVSIEDITTDVKYLVACRDEKFMLLSATLLSEQVEEVCSMKGSQQWNSEVSIKLEQLCRIRENASVLGSTASGEFSLCSNFQTSFPDYTFTDIELITEGKACWGCNPSWKSPFNVVFKHSCSTVDTILSKFQE